MARTNFYKLEIRLSFPLSANARSQPIPDELRETLAPARVALFEWTDYFFHWQRADALQIGERQIEPIAPGVFRVRWENALGLSSLTPMFRGEMLEAPLWVEVLSPKFPTPEKHVAFLRDLLARLFDLSPHLIWHQQAATSRGAQLSARQMSAPQTLQWALRFGEQLQQILAAIARQPARLWDSQNVDVAPNFVSDLSANQLQTLASDGARWRRGCIVGQAAPVRVPQLKRHQSFDNNDNQHALAFTRALANALIEAKSNSWFGALSENQRAQIESLIGALNGFGAHFSEPIGAPRQNWQPRAAPYRALWQLQQSLSAPGAPLWHHAEQLARVRDIAALWELHVFFDLIARIESVRGQGAQLQVNWDAERGMLAPSRANWDEFTLTFNGPAPSYSTPLRPDYLWSRGGKAVAAFDAKFRFEAQMGVGRGADLHKMHAYRDALNVSAAIALHPGSQTTFFDRERGPLGRVPFAAILAGEVAGVGLWGISDCGFQMPDRFKAS